MSLIILGTLRVEHANPKVRNLAPDCVRITLWNRIASNLDFIHFQTQTIQLIMIYFYSFDYSHKENTL